MNWVGRGAGDCLLHWEATASQLSRGVYPAAHGHVRLSMAVNVAQHKVTNLLKI